MKKKKDLFLISFSIISFLIGFLSFQRKLEGWHPLGFYMEDKEKGVTIVQIEAGSIAEKIGLKTKDIILNVNGLKGNSSSFKKILLSNKIGSQITVLRTGKILNFNYFPPEGKIDFNHLIFSFIGSVFFIAGLFTYFKEKNQLNYIFSFLMVLAFILFSVEPAGKVNDLWRTIYAFKTIASFLIFPTLINFFFYFPKIVFKKKLKFLFLIYFPGIILSFLLIDGYLLGGRFFINEEKIPFLSKLKFYYFILFSIFLFLIFLFQWIRKKTNYQWKKWIWATSGLFGFLPYIIFDVFLKELKFEIGIPLWALAIFMPLLPLSFSISLSTSRFNETYYLFFNAFYYLLILFFGLFVYLFLNLFLFRFFSEKIQPSQNFLLFLSGFLIAILLYFLRKKIYIISEKIFGTKTIEIQEKLYKFSHKMVFYKDLGILLEDLFNLLKENFYFKKINFYFYKDGIFKRYAKDETFPETISEEKINEIEKIYKIFPLVLKEIKIGAIFALREEPLSLWENSIIKNFLPSLSFYLQNLNLLNELEEKIKKLKYSENFLETLISKSPIGIIVLDEKGEIIKENLAAKEMLKSNYLKNSFDFFKKILNSKFLSEILNYEEKTLLITKAVFPFKESENHHIIFINDLTEKVNLQEALKEKEKLAILGQFSSIIAHEINTPLTIISSYAQILQKSYKENTKEYEKILYIKNESFHMSRLINSLLEFSRSQKLSYKPNSIKEIISCSINQIKPLLEEKKLKINVKDSKDFYFYTDPILLQQAVFNLIKNACEAVNFSGNVSLYWSLENSKVRIFVEDDGPGIKEEIKEKILEPFFSTKIGRGTGLGLTLTYAIIKAMGGELHFKSGKEKGTTVCIELPYENPDN